jgi:hypothetical protein
MQTSITTANQVWIMKAMERTSDAFLCWSTENGACNFEVTFRTCGVYILTVSVRIMWRESELFCSFNRKFCNAALTGLCQWQQTPPIGQTTGLRRHLTALPLNWFIGTLFSGTQTRVMIKPRNEPLQEHSCHQNNRPSWRLGRDPSDLHSKSTQLESRSTWFPAISSCKFLNVVKSTRISCSRTGSTSYLLQHRHYVKLCNCSSGTLLYSDVTSNGVSEI